MHRAFDRDPRTSDLAASDHRYFLHNLSMMSVEYTLLQMAKLHDPAIQQHRPNLSLAFVIDFGEWDAETLEELKRLHSRLEGLYHRIRPARHRVIAHNDMATLLEGGTIGEMPAGSDEEYFGDLQAFASIVSERLLGIPFEFTVHAETDVLVLLKTLSSSRAR